MIKFASKKSDIALTPMRIQVVTVAEFLKLYEEKRADILSARILPPKLGNADFGKIIIEWKHPVFVPLSSLDNEIFA